MTKEEIKKKQQQLITLTSAFCTEKVNDEYRELCEKLILKLGRKRDVPFKRGKLEIWAAAVVYAIGSINFLFDKSFDPYLTTEELHAYFGTKATTVSSKANKIKEMFDIWHYSPEFSTSHMTQANPMNNLVLVDGFITQISSLPPEIQVMVREARAAGKDIQLTTDPE
ncbi:DUF6398 domain-containing protein [Chitinophagales bacterium]|nr:DUF6398 domain-containing protein [Chitinophagales bacterium]